MYGQTEVVGMTRALEHIPAANVGKCLDPPPQEGRMYGKTEVVGMTRALEHFRQQTLANA